MVRLDRIYTGGGDAGETSLGDGTRVPKTAPIVRALGSVDEANATIGIVRLHVAAETDAMLARVQNDLFDVGADLCVPTNSERPAMRVTDAQVLWLEHEIDRLNEALTPLSSFVLPGGSTAAAYLHLARTVVRRAERDVVEAKDTPLPSGSDSATPTNSAAVSHAVLLYLNRLSDLLFMLARHTNDEGRSDVLWKPGAHR